MNYIHLFILLSVCLLCYTYSTKKIQVQNGIEKQSDISREQLIADKLEYENLISTYPYKLSNGDKSFVTNEVTSSKQNSELNIPETMPLDEKILLKDEYSKNRNNNKGADKSNRNTRLKDKDYLLDHYTSDKILIPIKVTAFDVCPRILGIEQEKEGEKITLELKSFLREGLDHYRLYDQQSCKQQAGAVYKRTVEDEFHGVNVVAQKIKCHPVGEVESNTFNMCTECFYQITLPEEYLLRHHVHVTCHSIESEELQHDYSCLMGEGTCVKKVVPLPNFKLKEGASIGSPDIENDYEEVIINFTKSCSCQVIESAKFLSMFV